MQFVNDSSSKTAAKAAIVALKLSPAPMEVARDLVNATQFGRHSGYVALVARPTP